jgi:trigger factor
MKKKLLFLLMSLCILVLAGGCAKKGVTDDLDSNKGSTDKTEETDGTDGTTEERELPKVEDFVASDYITLGQYKGVEVTVEKIEVTEEDITNAINDDLKENATEEEITDRPVQKGDTVNIDFEGLLDGKAFDGGTAKGYDLVIGSSSFIPGFEDGLVGAKIGEKLALDLTFPKDYNEELGGKAVVFNVTINSIKETKLPELTEEFVTSNTDYKSIEEYNKAIRTELEEQNQTEMENNKVSTIMTTVIDNSTIKELPKTLVDYYTAKVKYSFEDEAAMYGMDIETYVKNFGMSLEDYNNYVSSLVDAYATRDLLLTAVVQTEKLEATEEEYQETLTEYMTYYGVEAEEDLYKQVSKDDITESLVMQKAYDLIIKEAVVK